MIELRFYTYHCISRTGISSLSKPAITPRFREYGLDVLTAFAAAVLALCVVWVVLDLGEARWEIPLQYAGAGGDHLNWYMVVKTVLENGGPYTNPLLGLPTGFEAFDFPIQDFWHVWSFLAIGALVGTFGATVNIFYVMGYPLAAFSASLAFRKLGVSRAMCLSCAVLYAILPFHFYRGQYHLLNAAYYLVPLVMLPIIWIAFGRMNRGRGIFAVIITIITAGTGTYPVAFMSGFLMLAGLTRIARVGHWRAMVWPVALIGVLGVSSAIANLPTLRYQLEHGRNPQALQRPAALTEMFGLKLAQLLMPAPHHRVQLISEWREMYSRQFPLVNENDYSCLGLVGLIGFVALMLHVTRAVMRRPCDRRLATVAVLVIGAIAFTHVGGLSSIFSITISGHFRSQNRVIVFLAFLCLVALAWRADRWLLRSRDGVKPWIVSIVVLCIGIFDQTSAHWRPPFVENERQWDRDTAFVREIERKLGPTATIFQYPPIAFPEADYINNLSSYHHFRPYLHSSTLRWSHGGIRGRGAEDWVRKLPPRMDEQFAKTLVANGFDAIYYDRAAALPEPHLDTIRALAKDKVIVTPDRQLELIPLRPFSVSPAHP